MSDPTTIEAGQTETGGTEPTPTQPTTTGGFIDNDGNFVGDWKGQYLDEDIRNENFFNSDYSKNVKTLLKKAYHNEKLLGEYTSGKKKGVIIPNEKSTPEEVEAFRLAMGVPKEYQYKKPDDIDDDVVTSEFMTDTMKKLNEVNVSQKQFDVVMNIFQDRIRAFEKEGIEELNKNTREAIDRLQKEYGDKLDSRLDLAKRFITKITDKWSAEKYQELFGKENEQGERTGGINVPEFAHLRPLLIDLFAMVEETYGIPSSAALSDTTEVKAQSLEEQLKALEATPGFLDGKLRTSSNPVDRQKHEEIMKKRSDLIRRQTELQQNIRR
jgi:hypothetical protein